MSGRIQYIILANYGIGWEEIDSTDDIFAAHQVLESYTDEQPYAQFKIETSIDGEDDYED